MSDVDTEGRKCITAKHIFKAFPDNIDYLIYPEYPTFHQQDDAQGMNVYQSLIYQISPL